MSLLIKSKRRAKFEALTFSFGYARGVEKTSNFGGSGRKSALQKRLYDGVRRMVLLKSGLPKPSCWKYFAVVPVIPGERSN
jgi:hypothetical protein